MTATFYGLADYRREGGGEVVELNAFREAAEAALRAVLEDEPALTDELAVVAVEF